MQDTSIKEIINNPYTNFKNNILREHNTVKEAMIRINHPTIQIVFVVNKKKQLVGTITDGDIRRAILQKKDLNTPIKKIMHLNYFYVKNNVNHSYISDEMRKRTIHYVPLLNKKKIIQKIFSDRISLLKKNKIKQKYPIVILAGGKGLRMKNLTKKIPKPLLLFKKIPILEHIILNLKKNNYLNIYLSVHHLKEKIIKYFGNGKKFGVTINYIIEKKPLGTGGCIKMLPTKNNNPIIVMNSDIICDLNINNLLNYHKKNKAYATMAVRVLDKSNPYGVIKTSGINIKGFEEKPLERTYVNAGIYVFSSKVKKFLKTNKRIDMPEIFRYLKLKKKKIIIFPIIENWIDLGTYEKYNFYNKF